MYCYRAIGTHSSKQNIVQTFIYFIQMRFQRLMIIKKKCALNVDYHESVYYVFYCREGSSIGTL